MLASKLLGLAGFILLASIALLSYLLYEADIYAVKTMFTSTSTKDETKYLVGVAIGVALLFISIPALSLMWMAEIGNELERNTNSLSSTNKTLDNLKDELKNLSKGKE